MNEADTSVTVPALGASSLAGRSRWWMARRPLRIAGAGRRIVVAATLLTGDLVAILASTSMSQTIVNAGRPAPINIDYLSPMWLIVFFLVLGMYVGVGPSPYERFRLRAIGVMIYAGIELLLAFRLGVNAAACVFLFLDAVFLVLTGYYIECFLRRSLIRRGHWGAASVLVGCGAKNVELARKLLAEPELGLRPVGFLYTADDPTVGQEQFGLPVLGAAHDLDRLSHDLEVAIFTSTRTVDEAVRQGRAPSVHMFVVEDAMDMQSLWLRTRTICGAVGIEIRRDLHARHCLWLKRAIDLLLAVPAGLACLPVVGVLALAIKIVDPGPAFYRQVRVGRDGRSLKVLKLRSMYRDAEQRLDAHLADSPEARAEWHRFFKLTRDPRILPRIGNFIRRTSLDELPQIWNIIRGEMSIVGPRPFPHYHSSNFDHEFQRIRESVPPGLTGLWQVTARSDGDLAIQKAQDLFYIRNWSLWLDLYIILQTGPAVFSGLGAR
ncbi:MAG: sugar transferase [Alphaproteobacteria bacterium]|nr:sugar transferase [Alphaproteobacteria bacterium]